MTGFVSAYPLLLILVGAASAMLTGRVRRYALRAGLCDQPGARRSHARVTPRGGGLAIALTSLPAFAWLALEGVLAPTDALALGGAGALTAAIGFVDDHRPVAARWRLSVHLLAACWALYWLGRGTRPAGAADQLAGMLPSWIGELPAAWLPAPFSAHFLMLVPSSGAAGAVLPIVLLTVLVVLGLVWLLNLCNFMDGIDTIAALQAIVICVAGAGLYVITGHAALAIGPLVLAAACAGFLYWNLPPARIFLGDAGSGFLGIVIGVFALQAGRVDVALPAAWIVLCSAFLMDASMTLFGRILRGQRVWLAHREHAYQHLARRCGRHLPVSIGFALVTALWSAPLAALVALHRIAPATGILVGCVPLAVVALALGAGRPEVASR